MTEALRFGLEFADFDVGKLDAGDLSAIAENETPDNQVIPNTLIYFPDVVLDFVHGSSLFVFLWGR
jgi:hypothetical protein